MRIKYLPPIFITLIILGLIIAGVFLKNFKKPPSSNVRIAYFHGGRTMLLFRAYVNNEFDKMGVGVKLLTKDLYNSSYYELPKSYEEIKTKSLIGKARGGELINEALNDKTDASTPGESSFIKAASQNAPIVAVAMLGHDTKDHPGHAILFRKDVIINNPEDLKGRVLVSRRAGDGDRIILEEFLEKEGLNPKLDVKILEQVMDDKMERGLRNKEFDGGYYHLMGVEGLVQAGYAYVYRKLDWVNPELSHALLVFRKEFVKKHPDQVEKVIKVYMQRIKYEHSLPEAERIKDPGAGFLYGLQMAKDFQGMNLPQYDFPPIVRQDLLDSMQDLMIKHQVLEYKVNLSNFIDNSFVQKVYQELK